MLRRPDPRPAASLPTADQTNAVFGFDEVGFSMRGKAILRDLSLEVPAWGVTAVAGPSGSGKSTLTRLCNRLIDATEGTVRFRGVDVRDLDVLALRRAVGMVFQRPTVFEGTAMQNLEVTGVHDRDLQRSALAEVGLDPDVFGEREAATLSGGESQRLCLARVLLMRPDVVVADEPTAALDQAAARQLEELVCSVSHRGVPVLWVTHDPEQVERIADHRVVMDNGTVVGFTRSDEDPAGSTDPANGAAP